ncbi:MAG: YitT family protein [Clostridiales bacterium]|nr:YitT family protein [Clostridiales bacterium]
MKKLRDIFPLRRKNTGEEIQKNRKKEKGRRSFFSNLKKDFPLQVLVPILLGTAISSFGVYNIHYQTGITEGGVLGGILLINHWTGIPSSIISPILDVLAYALAFAFLGKGFLKLSIVATAGLAGFFRLWEAVGPVLPDLSAQPFLAAIIGGLFVGLGCGLVIRQGGAGSGDDALALAISKVTKCRISLAYLATDITVLALSLTYIPLGRIVYSLITVTVSSLLIDVVQNIGKAPVRQEEGEPTAPAKETAKKAPVKGNQSTAVEG